MSTRSLVPYMPTVLTWIALLLGAAASVAALWGHYGVLPGWLTGPEICRLEHGGCSVLFRSPRASPAAAAVPRLR